MEAGHGGGQGGRRHLLPAALALRQGQPPRRVLCCSLLLGTQSHILKEAMVQCWLPCLSLM